MSELTLTIIRLGRLVLLWIFVFSVVGVLRGDIYGTRVVSRTSRKPAPSRRTRGAAAGAAGAPAVGPAGAAGAAASRPAKRQPHSANPRTLVVTQGPLTGT